MVDTKSMGEHHAFATATLTIDSKEWKKYHVILKPSITDPKSTLRIFLASGGTVDLEHVSLFPVDTWKGHENGLRKDLAQALQISNRVFSVSPADVSLKEQIWLRVMTGKNQ